MKITFSEKAKVEQADVFVLAFAEQPGNFVEDKLKSILGESVPEELLKECQSLKYGEVKNFTSIMNGDLKKVIVAGAGKTKSTPRASLEKLGGFIFDKIKSKKAKVCLFNNAECSGYESAAAYIASGILLKSWCFDKYKSKKSDETISELDCQTNYIEINKRKFEDLEKIAGSVFTVREMVTEPANVMDPDEVVEQAKSLKKLGVKVNVLDKKDMAKLGMEALLGVAKGSDKPAYIVTMEYKNDENKEKIAIVGKGLTFDSGGICLKPSKGMADMKGDMTGSAVVIGTIKALALQGAKVNVVGVIGVVENMISGSAQKPGDIVKAMSGTTIEVDNTDAEGRLVLADALWYTEETFNPGIIIDFATLTGAIQVALGHEFAGLFSNSDKLCEDLTKSSERVGEKLWRLPLHPSYEGDINSDIADIKNVGSGRGAGSITAALFLKHFVKSETKWAHIDIAATEWDTKNRALSQKGATGFGVRLMDDFIKNYYSLSGFGSD